MHVNSKGTMSIVFFIPQATKQEEVGVSERDITTYSCYS